MTRFVLSVFLAASSALFAQPTPTPAPPSSGNSGAAVQRDPQLYQVADTAFKAPTDWYKGEQKIAYGEIQSLSAVTDNYSTIIKVEYKSGTDTDKVSVRLYIDSDGNASTGSGVGFYPGQTPVRDFGFDWEVYGNRYYVSVRPFNGDCCQNNIYVKVADSGYNFVSFRISNRLFGGDGVVQNMRFQAVMFDNGSGANLSISPADGVAYIPSTTIVRISPATGTKLFKIGQEDTTFSLVADITTIAPPNQVSYFIQSNGINITDSFVSNARSGQKTVNQARVGGPNYFNYTKRFVYPIDSIIRNGGRAKIVFTVLTPEGSATEVIEYTAEGIVEQPQQTP